MLCPPNPVRLCWCRANLEVQDPNTSGSTLCSYIGPKPVMSEHRYKLQVWIATKQAVPVLVFKLMRIQRNVYELHQASIEENCLG